MRVRVQLPLHLRRLAQILHGRLVLAAPIVVQPQQFERLGNVGMRLRSKSLAPYLQRLLDQRLPLRVFTLFTQKLRKCRQSFGDFETRHAKQFPPSAQSVTQALLRFVKIGTLGQQHTEMIETRSRIRVQ
jgi:hypothetical protein